MEARLSRAALLAAPLLAFLVASLGAGYRTQNFVVDAPTTDLAEKIGKAAEKFRRDLAVEWLGKPLPNWPSVCPIHAQVAPHLGAGGATSFMFDHGEVFGWQMNIQGSEERILDSVLPHEVTHTIFASYFRRPLPRWADEGACTTVEDISERTKQDKLLIQFLKTGRGIAFSQMFVMTEYPQDILPLYAQGYSLARFLIAQKGKKEFLTFVGEGMSSDDWTGVTTRHYGYKDLGVLQNTWLDWVKQGSPMKTIAANTSAPSAETVASAGRVNRAGSPPIVRAQGPDRSPRDSAVAINLGERFDANQPKTDLVPVVAVTERRPSQLAPPVRNGSVAIDSRPVAAAPEPTAVTFNSAPLETADPGSAAGTTSGSVYGPGAGLIHHSDEGAMTPPPQVSAATPDNSQVVQTAQRSGRKVLEWTR